MATNKKQSHADYTELTDEQVRTALRDALRQTEHGHMQASLQLELEQAREQPDKQNVEVLERQVRDHDVHADLLRKKLAALPGE